MATFDVIWTQDRPNEQFPAIGSLYYFGTGLSLWATQNPRIGGPMTVILPSSWAESGRVQICVDDYAETPDGRYIITVRSGVFPPVTIGTKVDVDVQQDIVIPQFGVNCRIRRGVITEL